MEQNDPVDSIISSYGDDRQQGGEVVENSGGNQEQQRKDRNNRHQIDQVVKVVQQVIFEFGVHDNTLSSFEFYGTIPAFQIS